MLTIQLCISPDSMFTGTHRRETLVQIVKKNTIHVGKKVFHVRVRPSDKLSELFLSLMQKLAPLHSVLQVSISAGDALLERAALLESHRGWNPILGDIAQQRTMVLIGVHKRCMPEILDILSNPVSNMLPNKAKIKSAATVSFHICWPKVRIP